MVIGIILGIVFVILAIGGGIAAYCFFDNESKTAGTLSVIGCILFAILFICIPFSFHTVETGEVAVVKEFGEAKEIKTAGMHYDFWMTKSYTRYDTKVQNVDIETASYSSDAQTMNVTMTLQYQIIEDNVLNIVKEYGNLATLQNRIQSVAVEKTKSVLSSYKAMDIIAERISDDAELRKVLRELIKVIAAAAAPV